MEKGKSFFTLIPIEFIYFSKNIRKLTSLTSLILVSFLESPVELRRICAEKSLENSNYRLNPQRLQRVLNSLTEYKLQAV